ncbi:MAG: hypothetical protein Ct9H300mP19_04550 [Dehalococcoidia bacterium]|nr:MAG: hypothetical protein Ct9H300mP19_04550 [Dehalococcoidia bacterium]
MNAASQATLERSVFDSYTQSLGIRNRINLENQIQKLIQMGYAHEPTVEIPGTFSRRGGILDIFPVSKDRPVRIELFDDEIESIRHFDPLTQRSAGKVRTVTILPAYETLPQLANQDRVQELLGEMDLIGTSEEAQRRIPSELSHALAGEVVSEIAFYAGFFNLGSVFDYLPAESLMVAQRPGAIEETARSQDSRMARLREIKEKRGDVPVGFAQPYIEWGFISEQLSSSEEFKLSPWGMVVNFQVIRFRLPLNHPSLTSGGVDQAINE